MDLDARQHTCKCKQCGRPPQRKESGSAHIAPLLKRKKRANASKETGLAVERSAYELWVYGSPAVSSAEAPAKNFLDRNGGGDLR
jgi:hypothetical protein